LIACSPPRAASICAMAQDELDRRGIHHLSALFATLVETQTLMETQSDARPIAPKVCRRAQRDISNGRIVTPEELERRQLPRSLAVAAPHARRL
jgi:hypothetical protein